MTCSPLCGIAKASFLPKVRHLITKLSTQNLEGRSNFQTDQITNFSRPKIYLT